MATRKKTDAGKVFSFKGGTFPAEDFVNNGKFTPLGGEYLLQFKRFSLFDTTGKAVFFIICLPILIPLAIFRFVSLFAAFGIGLVLNKYLSISLDKYPKIISIIYFLCLGVYVRVKDKEPAGIQQAKDSGLCTVIVSNHNARFDAMLLSNLHQSDSTYLAVAKASFFGQLLINSGLCNRSMEDGIALDTKAGREEWRRRLNSGYERSILFFPEGRVVHAPNTIITFQTHLFQGQKMNIICKKNEYKSYFLDYTQIEIPFFKSPYSKLKNKRLWDSIIEIIPFLVSFVTVFNTEAIGTLQLTGKESYEEINEALYSIYSRSGYKLVNLDQNLVKILMDSLYI